MTTDMFSRKRVHFIGIGGIGMSALAYFFLKNGARVSGSDLVPSSVTRDLEDEGAKIKIGSHRPGNLPAGTELVIYTAAAKKDNPELVSAKKRGMPIFSYPEALGELTKLKKTIAVAGSHGKSTTTTLAGLLLQAAGFDPTVVVGTKVKEFGKSTFRFGRSRWLVVEADEWQAGYLQRWPHSPQILILTNIDREHLDLFSGLAMIKKSFRELAERLPVDGLIIANGDDKNTKQTLRGLRRKISYYSLKEPAARQIEKVIKVPGRHNIANCLAIWHLGKFLKIPEKTILRTIANFRGTWRRFEYQGQVNGAMVLEDYAHHPTEIKATLLAARELLKAKRKNGRLWCVFQPHQYQRTKFLFKEFTRAFDAADYLLLLDIFRVLGAREKQSIIREVNSELLAEAIRKRGAVPVRWLESFEKASRLLETALAPGDICLVVGAGNVSQIFNHLKVARRPKF